ncbi:MAG TPA: Na+/H+ antiporter [Candidatus Rubrimentiphilum sp.]|nr:Na+/H+ antiporter [Candidatus Rubrimentiphilum sp.]
MTISALAVVAGAIIVLVAIAKRINVAYPIVLVLGGIAIGYIPGVPTATMRPDLVLLVFLPPLLYWESVTAPSSDFKTGAWWIFQLAFGLVVVTTVAVAVVIHFIDANVGWAAAFVLGAIVASTDEVAFVTLAERLRVPRHLVATIEGESLINDATSLILYGVAVAAVVGQSFSLGHALGSLVLSVVAAVAIGIVAGAIVVGAWALAQDEDVQPIISLIAPYISYLPAYFLGVSGVLAVVVTGLFVSRFTPRVLLPRTRLRAVGFWVTIVFVLNAFIFVLIGLQFRSIVSTLSHLSHSIGTLILYGVIVSAVVIVVRIVWVFAQALLPVTNEPEHAEGEADWSHVAVLAWTGMRGGISLAAALAIPLTVATGPFPQRDLIIFLTLCVLLATLVGQGGSLPWLLKRLKVKDDGADEREERLAMARTARIALIKLSALRRERQIPDPIMMALRQRFRSRWREFENTRDGSAYRERIASLYRGIERELLDVQRAELIRLRDRGKIDNTVMRRVLTLLDLEDQEISMLGSTGHMDLDPEK